MKKFKDRLRQKSTWLGILTAGITLVLTNGVFTPEIIVSLASSLGLIVTDEQQPSGK